MGYKIGVAIPIGYYAGSSGLTIKARIEDESGAVFGAELTLVENAAFEAVDIPGFYESSFTPDAAGRWTALIYYGGVKYGQMFYDVGGGLTAQEKTDVGAEVADIQEASLVVAGLVVEDVANSNTTFETNLPNANNDFYNSMTIKFTSGVNSGQARGISDYDGGTKFVTVSALQAEPGAGDTFQIIPRVVGAAGGGDATEAKQDIIIAKTDNLPVDPADASDIAAAHALLATEAKQDIIDTNIDTILGRVTAAVALASVCTEARLAELAAANLPADVDTLLTRVTAAVATATALATVDTNVDTLVTRVTAAVALASVCTEARLAELAAANMPADIDTLLTRITAAVATASALATVDANVDTILGRVTAAVALASVCTEARLARLDADISSRAPASEYDADVEEAHERAFLRRYPFVTTNESVSDAAEVSLAAPAVVTATFPTGATRLNSYVVAILKVNNQTAAGHNIGVTLQKNIAAAGWVDVRDFTASPPLTLPAVDGTGDSITFIEPVSVTTGQSVQFRFQVDSDDAGEVHYTQVFFFAVEYDFQ